MINDLRGSGAQKASADILVIGAGTAGLPVATKLAERHLKVICIESGQERPDLDHHPLNEVEHGRAVYAGATDGRFRGLGGTSSRWGGALIPLQEADLRGHGWPIPYEEIIAYRREVETLFGLVEGPYNADEAFDRTGDFVMRLAKWPPFANRNVANLLDQQVRSANGPAIWLNATATEFTVEGNRLRRVLARAPDGGTLEIDAREVIFAAGAIESTRLALLLDREMKGALSHRHDQLGRYFHDHLSVVVGELKVIDRRALNQYIGFRFEHGTMRNLRFELAPESRLRQTVPPIFAHIGFEDTGGAFEVVRDLYRRVQQRRLPTVAMALRLAGAAPWLTRAGWWRFFRHRLLFPDRAKLQVHVVLEQVPDPANRITLSPTSVDAYGQPRARIDWAPGHCDEANLTRAVTALEHAWASSPLAELAHFVRSPPGRAEADVSRGGGIYHPGGSTRMANSPASGVVDSDLHLFGCPNVTILATSVLPNGGGANPTMMLLMLACRAVNHLASKRQSGQLA